MSEQINMSAMLERDDESFEACLGTAILESFSKRYRADEICKNIDQPPHIFDVDLRINGKEVSFSDLIKWLHMNFDITAKKAARDVIYDALGEQMDLIANCLQQMHESLENAGERLVESLANREN